MRLTHGVGGRTSKLPPSMGLNRPISAYFLGGLSFLVSARILTSRLAKASEGGVRSLRQDCGGTFQNVLCGLERIDEG